MALLGIDIGSSSIKCGLLNGPRVVGQAVTVPFKTTFAGVRAEVNPEAILRALGQALRHLGPRVRRAEAIALSTMSPSWLAMDRAGKAITPIITHQDRRSVEIALEMEQRFGRERHLRLVGNRPFPGGISSTTAAWFVRHEPARMRHADLVGHLPTFLHRRLTGARVIDPSNASFMGLFDVPNLGGWVEEVCQAIGLPVSVLPDIVEGDMIAGRITRTAAARYGLVEGMPMLAGVVDGSAAMLLSGARIGQLMNAAGSTDVLALVTNNPRPHERLLTRSIGIGRKWLSVSTLAAAGSAITWARDQLFPDLSWDAFTRLVRRAASDTAATRPLPRFSPYLGGDRMSIEQKHASIDGITLATTRADLLAALIRGLAHASAQRLDDLAINTVRIRREVFVTGGASRILGDILHRDWHRHGKWTFRFEKEATLRGLGTLTPRKRR